MESTQQHDTMEQQGRQGGSTSSRGFASMNQERQREIARKGGRAAHAKGTAHEFTSDEARAAGQKGGQRVSSNREHMSRIGRIGGKKSAGRRQEIRQGKGDGSNGGDMGGSQPGRDGGADRSADDRAEMRHEASENE